MSADYTGITDQPQEIQHQRPNKTPMACHCNLEFCSVIFNCLTSLGVVALIVFMFGSNAWCIDSVDDAWCDAFGGELGILYCFLLMIGLCISPCFLDCFVSCLSKTSVQFKEEPFGSRYADIHEHTFRANEECVKNNESAHINPDNEDNDDEKSAAAFSPSIAYKVPIIYSTRYNITACGIEKLHPFDSSKYGRIHEFLTTEDTFTPSQFITPPCAARSDLLTVHTVRYLSSLTSSWAIMKILELPGICLLPAPILFWRALMPMMYQTGGTILGVEFAYKYGWCINLGGGFHHASSARGGGFCVYADITIAIQYIRSSLKNKSQRNMRVLIVDLDAHQGNGHERDVKDFFKNDGSIKVLDGFNANIYPGDTYAKQAIHFKMTVGIGCGDHFYLPKLNEWMDQAMSEFRPQFIVYNAGTDCLEGDPLGAMRITSEGIRERDEIVFKQARDHNVPVLMVLSGGYQLNNARVIANSIQNLKAKGLLQMKR